MKCRVCRGKAAVEVRRHNAAFCSEHFVGHCREQVRKTVERGHMFAPADRVLVAVSGGKDSLALWDVLLESGYHADGLYLALGIGDYSDASREKAEKFAAGRQAELVVVDVPEDYGYDVPVGSRAAGRSACSACGLSKRYIMNQIALERGYDVLATGHNLDDEAAVLLGNVLNWNVEALGRQRPVLPVGPGFVRKVKPLVRLAERETAAYAVLRGIDYIVEECPLVGGNTGLRYKEAMNEVEAASPGTKHRFYFGFLESGLERFAPHDEATGDDAPDSSPEGVHPCARCGAPTTAEVCAFCRLRTLATDPDRLAGAMRPVRGGRRRRR